METSVSKIVQLSEVLNYLTPEEREQAQEILRQCLPKWSPLVGPQLEAYESPADILYFGGSAGGAKSDFVLGLALNEHRRSIIFRREATQTVALVDRLAEILGTREGFNAQHLIWRFPGRQIEFGSCPHPGDELRFQGRPHDLLAFDEICHFLEIQFRFLSTWNRTTVQGQRCRIVCTGNPPTTEEGRWVIQYWAPWLDDKHPNPAKPGELRWFSTIDGKDVEFPTGKPVKHKGEIIIPRSRTFIPSRVTDNPFLMATDYKKVLEALPEPLRSQMLHGDFQAGMEDSDLQVVPTTWVDAAMARWSEHGKTGQMDSVGVDVARGGRDKTVIAIRYGNWYAPLITYPGTATPDGAITSSYIIAVRRDYAPIHVDAISVGGSVIDHLKSNGIHVVPIVGSGEADLGVTDKATGLLRFVNKRSQIWWQFRESLDPKIGDNMALPPDPELRADLCAPMWTLTTRGILIESKEDRVTETGAKVSGIKSRLGRSPDKGEAVVYCSINTPKIHPSSRNWRDRMPKTTWRSA